MFTKGQKLLCVDASECKYPTKPGISNWFRGTLKNLWSDIRHKKLKKYAVYTVRDYSPYGSVRLEEIRNPKVKLSIGWHESGFFDQRFIPIPDVATIDAYSLAKSAAYKIVGQCN